MCKKHTASDNAFWMSMVEPALVGIAWLLAPAPAASELAVVRVP